MRVLAVVASLLVAPLVLPSGCGPNPSGVGDCRAIENARCRAAAICGIVDDIARCERFYRDQCLHGLPVDSPGAPALNACIAQIEHAGDCAANPGSGCDPEPCAFVLAPERIPECAFLGETEEPPPDPGSAGAGGEASSEPNAGAPSTDTTSPDPGTDTPSPEPSAGAGGVAGG